MTLMIEDLYFDSRFSAKRSRSEREIKKEEKSKVSNVREREKKQEIKAKGKEKWWKLNCKDQSWSEEKERKK